MQKTEVSAFVKDVCQELDALGVAQAVMTLDVEGSHVQFVVLNADNSLRPRKFSDLTKTISVLEPVVVKPEPVVEEPVVVEKPVVIADAPVEEPVVTDPQ